MNILYISAKRGWGGVVTWMYRTAIGLEGRGHKVWILSHPKSRFNLSEPKGVRILPKKLGMDCNPVIIGFLIAFIRKHGIDLVVTNIQKEVLAGGMAARICGIPNVRRIGNADDLKDRIRWGQEHLVDHSIVPSDHTLRVARMRTAWIDPARFTTIHNGVDPVEHTQEDVTDVRQRWGLTMEDTVIGCTSSLAKVKGIDALISAFAILAGDYPHVFLVLSGEGPEEPHLRDLARTAGLERRVVFGGFTDEPAKAAAAYDIAVLNSSVEGFPNTIIEYMAAGRPVICTGVGGIPEVVTDGVNGILIRPGDNQGLIENLRFLLSNPAAGRELGRRARETIRQGFSESIMVDKVEALFKKVISKESA
jgi:glycosyltransferase involved in cell wall biosynthesis